MKKVILLICLCMGMCIALFAQKSKLPQLSVVEFNTNPKNEKIKEDAVAVRNMVERHMTETRKFKYEIVKQGEIDKLLLNQKIQVINISNADNIEKLKSANINYIVTGSIDAVGDDYKINIKLLDIPTGQFFHNGESLVGNNSRDLFVGVNRLMSKFIAEMPPPPKPPKKSKTVQEPPAREISRRQGVETVQIQTEPGKYKIGDLGPASGIIFYDKGTFSDGWRYLEAAPVETEFTNIQWGALGKDIHGTGTSIGSGKRNTQIIVEQLKQFRESGRAAQVCANMKLKGFSDWFLPSRDELNLMHRNLRQKGLGGFTGGTRLGDTSGGLNLSDVSFSAGEYWSSSQRSNDNAWYQRFSDGRRDTDAKNATYRVRAIRAF